MTTLLQLLILATIGDGVLAIHNIEPNKSFSCYVGMRVV